MSGERAVHSWPAPYFSTDLIRKRKEGGMRKERRGREGKRRDLLFFNRDAVLIWIIAYSICFHLIFITSSVASASRVTVGV